MPNNVSHILVLTGYSYIFFCEEYVQVFVLFLICLLLSICGGSLYNLDVSPLLDICCEYFLPVLGLANHFLSFGYSPIYHKLSLK